MGLGLTDRLVRVSTSFFVCLCRKSTEGSVEVSTLRFREFREGTESIRRFSVFETSEARGRRALLSGGDPVRL
jgi:hypothetical protein